MEPDLRYVQYGSPALSELRDAIARAKDREPLAPVTVVVPSNQVGVSARRELGRGSAGPICGTEAGLIGVTFLTPYRLAELLGAARLAAEGRRPVSTPVLTAAVRAELAVDAGVFSPFAAHPATESALVSSHRELRDLSPRALTSLAATSPRAADVVRLHGKVRSRLASSWYDEVDLLDAAVATASGSVPTLGELVVYLPQQLGSHAARLLRTLAASTPTTILAGHVGTARADADVAASVALLLDAPPLTPVLDNPYEAVFSDSSTRVVTASDAEDEVRSAVRVVIEAVRAGTRLDRIAVLHASPEPYARILREHLAAAGVAVNGSSDVPLAARVAGRTLLGALDLPGTNLRRQDVLAWLTESPIRHDGRPVPTSAWERISRQAGVVGRRDDWDRLLANHARRLGEEADGLAADPDQPEWRENAARQDAARALDLRQFVLRLADDLQARAGAPDSWSNLVTWARKLLSDLVGSDSARARWPDLERRALERIEVALDRLTCLDDVEGLTDLDVFARTLRVELEADLGRIGRFGEGVLVGPVSMGVGVHLDLVVLVGMAEGSFPTTVREDSLLPDAERAVTAGELPLRSGQADRLHHWFLAVAAGAERQVLCVPRGDLRRSSERVPSRWVLDVASRLAGERWWSTDLRDARPPWLVHVASFDAGLRTSAEPATEQEYRLRRLMAEAPSRSQLPDVARAVDDVLGRGVDLLDGRHSTQLTRFDGNLAGLTVPSPLLRATSATRLESWAACPFAYFLRHVLRVESIEHPEEELHMTPLTKGNLVHEALERFIEAVLARPLDDRPAPNDPWTPDDHQLLARIGEELCDRYEQMGLTGRAIFWDRDRQEILEDLGRFLRSDDQRRARDATRPVAAELPFGMEGELPAVDFPLGDGRSVPIRGKADRIDLATDGTVHVLDYKTGRSEQYKKLTTEDPHACGTRLQLAVYGQAARLRAGDPDARVVAAYWFTSRKGRFETIGYEVTPEVIERVSTAMRTIVDGIEAGLFAPHPKEHTTSPFNDCWFCDPDFLGTGELRRGWLRKLDDPVLADYVRLAELVPADDAGQEASA